MMLFFVIFFGSKIFSGKCACLTLLVSSASCFFFHLSDCFGQQMLKNIKENGLEMHNQYGCYFLDDGVPESMIHHIDGRRWMTPEQRAEKGLPPLPDIMNK